jgi:hypothetical protein
VFDFWYVSLGFGSLILWLLLLWIQAVKSEHDNKRVVCFGEMLIDFVPTVGGVSLAEAPTFKKAPGGAPANVVVGIARLGGNVAFVGKVSFFAL